MTPPTQSKKGFVLASVFFWLILPAGANEFSVDTTTLMPASVKAKLRGTLQGKYAFTDKIGQHTLILTRNVVSSEVGMDNISLKAVQYLLKGGAWKQEWSISDNLSCEGLDLEVDFIHQLTTISDIDKNGLAESTVAYQLSCAGDIEPRLTKVILRQGNEKYSVRGESLVKIEGAESSGGTFSTDSILDSKLTFRQFLVSIWKRAAGINL